MHKFSFFGGRKNYSFAWNKIYKNNGQSIVSRTDFYQTISLANEAWQPAFDFDIANLI